LFQKYIQNKFLLTLLYILAFSFIVSFFWTKSQIKNQFDAVLEINFTSLNNGIMQLYFDDGEGFSEDKSFRKNYISSERKQSIYFPLKNRNYKQFRIDPIDSGNIEFIIHDIRLIDISQGKVLYDFDKEKFTINQLIVDKSKDLKLIGKETTDPQIYLNTRNIEVINNMTKFEKIKFFISKFSFLFLFIISVYYLVKILKKAIEDKNKNLIAFFVLLPIVFLLLIVRTPDALISPVLYAEDGTWLGRIYVEGLWNVLINARLDYFVVGNILGLFFAKYLSYTFFAYDISTLPFFIAIQSYAFFALIAVSPIILLKNHIRLELLIMLSFVILLLPFGWSTNEIIGRLNNIGYFLFPLSIMLLIYRLDIINEKKKVIIIDALLVFCMLTNPMVVLFIITYFLLRYFFGKQDSFEYKAQFYTFVIAFLIFIYIVYIKITLSPQTSLTTETFLIENLFEVSISRSILYPFIFPIYSKLGDLFSLIILLIFLTTFYLVFKTLQYKDKKVFLILSFALVFVTFFTTFTKPGLTHYIKDYSGTFPDRYFSAQNIMSLLVVIFMIEKALILRNKFIKNITKLFIVMLILIYSVFLSKIIEFQNPKMKIMINDTFLEEVYKIYQNKEKSEIYQIPITPNNWIMQLPFKYVINTSLNKEAK
jgi:hypothetical protein